MKPLAVVTLLALLTLPVLFGLGCAETMPGRHPTGVGFLSDYSELTKGTKSQAELVHVTPGVDWAAYDKILLDPVSIYGGTESRSHGLSHAQSQELANYFYQLIYNGFAAEYTMVQSPGPGTLRFQAALTRLDDKKVALDVVSTVVPQARGLDTLQRVVTGKFAFKGAAAVEARVLDAETGQILIEGIDKRVGGMALNDNYLKKWGDVDNIMKFWVARSVHNLCTAQKRPDCPPMPSNF